MIMSLKKELVANQLNQKVLKNLENNLRLELSDLFNRMGLYIQSELAKYWSNSLLLQGQVNLIVAPIHELHQEYDDILNKYKSEMLRKGYLEGQRLVQREYKNNRHALKAKKPIRFQHDRNSLFGTLPETEEKLRQDTFMASDKTLNRVDESISEILSEGYREGHGINQVSNNIRERFDQLKDWEATRIARTELHTAHSLGRRTAYADMNVSYTEWITSHDGRVRGLHKGDRANHVIMDGEIIPFGGTYSNGLKYPGDKSGKIEEWINCRCSEAPFVVPFGYIAPSFSPFREEDLIPIEDKNPKDLLQPQQPVTEPPTPQLTEEPQPQIKTEPSKPLPLKQHLRNELPSEFGDKTVTYIANTIKKRGKKAKTEYGQIFDYKTGKTTSPEFNGKKSQVAIVDRGYIKPLDEMSLKELLDLRKHPEKYIESYVDGSNSLASQHNHPKHGMPCFSDTDIYHYVSTPWEDYGLAVSEHETWVCECKGVMDTHTASKIKEDVGKIIEDSKKQSRGEFEKRYGYSIPKTPEESRISTKLGRETYAQNFLNYFDKNKHYGIKIKRIVY